MRYRFKAECFKALAHPLRIQILDALRDGPISVGELQEKLDVGQSTLSQQLAVLRARNFVHTERQGTSVRYEISDPVVWRLLDAAFEMFDNHLVNVKRIIDGLQSGA